MHLSRSRFVSRSYILFTFFKTRVWPPNHFPSFFCHILNILIFDHPLLFMVIA